MRNIFKQQAGLSLVELLVTVAITVVLLAGIFGILSTSIQTFQNTADQGTNIQLARNALNVIASEVRNATAISRPAVPNGAGVTDTVLDYVAPDSVPFRITMGSGADVNTVLIINLNTNETNRVGQQRVKAGSLKFIRSWDALWSEAEKTANKRIIKVELVMRGDANSIETPLSTVITTLNSL